MEIITHIINNKKIAELISDKIIIHSVEDALSILGDLYYDGIDKIILYEKDISPEFFDLKTKMAGDILQKFSNYRMQLAIVGSFNSYASKSLKDFIYESNKTGLVNFVGDLAQALK